MQERRRDPREPDEYKCLYCMYDDVKAYQIRDISLSGVAVLFQRNIEFKVGSSIKLKIFAKDNDRLLATIKGHVVRTFKINETYGVGIEFDEARTPQIRGVMDYLTGHSNTKE